MVQPPWLPREDVPDTWDCEAYGPMGREIGAYCFVAGVHGQRCRTAEICHAYMQQERQRIFARIRANAARGDATAIWIAQQFTSPDQLLNADPKSYPDPE